jgi:hypothetical protein
MAFRTTAGKLNRCYETAALTVSTLSDINVHGCQDWRALLMRVVGMHTPIRLCLKT